MLRYSQSHLCRTRLLVTYFGYTDARVVRHLRQLPARREARARRRPARSRSVARRARRAPRRRSATTRARRCSRRRCAAAAAGRGRALKIERVKRPVFGPLEKGDLVRHATWGDGEVVRVVGDSDLHVLPGARREAAQGELPRESRRAELEHLLDLCAQAFTRHRTRALRRTHDERARRARRTVADGTRADSSTPGRSARGPACRMSGRAAMRAAMPRSSGGSTADDGATTVIVEIRRRGAHRRSRARARSSRAAPRRGDADGRARACSATG